MSRCFRRGGTDHRPVRKLLCGLEKPSSERLAGSSPTPSAYVMLREITHPALRVVRHASTSEARELLAAAVERDLLELQTVGRIVDLMPLGDLRAELTLLSRWVLGGIDRQRELILVFEKEGDSLPDLRDRFYEAGDLSYRVAVDYVRRLSKANPRMEGVDPEALAAVTMNALVNHRRCLWTFKRNPLDLDDERMVSGGVDVLMHLAGPDAESPGI